MKVAIIKYNAGNIQSVRFAMERMNVKFNVTDDPEEIQSADKVIFPGVGEARTTMTYLREKKLDQLITNLKQPVLGICLGMQLMCQHSDENDTPCLGIFDETVQKFETLNGLKVPHMGWNSLQLCNDWLPESLQQKYVYFVHSYYVPVSRYSTAVCTYGVDFSASLRKDNFFAVQFHPEKSAEAGELVLQSFFQTK
jgi:imidazole glycerol-phosphate synthase subunit HisH